jgi:60 kDa SS-A/Ro ribonucleoprotein
MPVRLRASRPAEGDAVPSATAAETHALDDFAALRRFVTLGSERGCHVASEPRLTRDQTAAVERCLALDGPRAVDEIVALSQSGLAPSNEPALFALALGAGVGEEATRGLAFGALPQVARTSTDLFEFVSYMEELCGWDSALRRAIAGWYDACAPELLAREAIRHRNRPDRTHRELLRLAYGEPLSAVGASASRRALYRWIACGGPTDGLPRVLEGFAAAQDAASFSETAALVREYGLPREAVCHTHLESPEVWAALLAGMDLHAVLAELPRMGLAGVLAAGSPATAAVVAALAAPARGSVTPLALLSALHRQQAAADPAPELIAALAAAFDAAVAAAEPIGVRMLVAIDVSRSMRAGWVAGLPGLCPRTATAALAFVAAAAEPHCELVGFFADEAAGGWTAPSGISGDGDGLTPLPISAELGVRGAIAAVSDLPFGETDLTLPMRYALATGREVETFVVYTDTEPDTCRLELADALREYRLRSGIPARLVVVGMGATGLSRADPEDPGMLDVAGYTPATGRVIAAFVRGELD